MPCHEVSQQDTVGLGHSALATIKDIGVVLIQQTRQGEGGAVQLAATESGTAQLVGKGKGCWMICVWGGSTGMAGNEGACC